MDNIFKYSHKSPQEDQYIEEEVVTEDKSKVESQRLIDSSQIQDLLQEIERLKKEPERNETNIILLVNILRLKIHEFDLNERNTGTGKSTTIHFLAGSDMQEVTIGKINHIQPTNIKNCQANTIETNPFSQSVTKYLQPVQIKCLNKQFILLDTPGFNDTEGPIIDLVNGFSVIQAIQQTKSVRPVVVINYQMIGSRLEGLKKLSHVLSSMIDSLEDSAEAFFYIFTKYPINEQAGLEQRVMELKASTQKQDQFDGSYQVVLDDLAMKLHENEVVFLDPIQDSYQDILKQICKQKSYIKDPFHSFQIYFTEESKNILEHQCLKIKEKFQRALQLKDYIQANDYMNDLQYLAQTLRHQDLENTYNEYKKLSSESINQAHNLILTQFIKSANDSDKISEDLLIQLTYSITEDKKADILRLTHLQNEKVIYNGNYLQQINKMASQMVQKAKEDQNNEIMLNNTLRKLDILGKYFETVQPNFQELLSIQMNSIKINEDNFFDTLQFDENSFSIFKVYIKSLDSIRDLSSKNLYIDQAFYISQRSQKRIQELGESALILLKEDLINIQQMKQIQIIYENLVEGHKLFMEQEMIPCALMKQYSDKIFSELLTFYEKHYNALNISIQDKEYCFSNNVKEHYQQVNNLRDTIIDLFKVTNSSFQTIQKQITENLTDLKQTIVSDIKAVEYSKDKDKYINLQELLHKFKNWKWIDDEKEFIYKQYDLEINKTIHYMANQLKQLAIALKIDIQSCQNIKAVVSLTYDIEEVSKLQNQEYENNSNMHDAINYLTNQVVDLVKFIQGKVQEIMPVNPNKKINFTLNLSDYQKYINVIDEILDIRQDQLLVTRFIEIFKLAEKIKYDLERKLNQYGKFIQSILREALLTIQNYNGFDKQQINNQAYIIFHRIAEIQNVKKYTQQFQDSICQDQNIFEIYTKELEDYLLSLRSEIEQQFQQDQLNDIRIKIYTIQQLQKVDCFMKEETFKKTYQQLHQIYLQRHPQQQQQYYKLITDYKFIEILNKLNELEKHKDDSQVNKQIIDLQQFLNNTVEDLIIKTKVIAQRTKLKIKDQEESLKVISQIVDNLNLLQKCKQLSQKKIITEENNTEKAVCDISQILNNNISKQMDQIKELINTKNFSEAVDAYNYIVDASARIGIYASKKLIDYIAQFQEIMENQIKKCIDGYKKFDTVSDIMFKPADELYRKLKKLETHSHYLEYIEQFEDILRQLFMDELGKIKAQNDLHQKEHSLQQLKLCLQSIPEHIMKSLNLQILNYENSFRNEQQYQEYLIQQSLENQDLKSMKNILDSQKVYGKLDYKRLGDVQKYFKVSDERDYNEIFDQIQKHGFHRTLIETLKHQNELDQIYKQYFDLELPFFQKIKKMIQIQFDTCSQVFERQAENNEDQDEVLHEFINEGEYENNSSSNGFDKNSSSYKVRVISEFIHFYKQDPQLCKKFLPSVDVILDKQLRLFIDKLTEEYKQFNKSLQANNLKQLSFSINTFNQYNMIITKLKQPFRLYIQSEGIIEPPYVTFFDFNINKACYLPLQEKRHILEQKLNDLISYKGDFQTDNQILKYYEDIDDFLKQYQLLTEIKFHLQEKEMQQILNDYVKKLTDVQQEKFQIFSELSPQKLLTSLFCKKFDYNYKCIMNYHLIINQKYRTNLNIQDIKQSLLKMIDEMFKQAKQKDTFDSDIEMLISSKQMSMNITSFRNNIDQKINEFISSKQNANHNGGYQYLSKLRIQLEKDPTGIQIIQDYKIFSTFAMSIFNQRTHSFGIKQVLELIESDDIDKIKIESLYESFEYYFKQQITSYLDANIDKRLYNIQIIKNNIKLKSKPCTTERREQWHGTFKSELHIILAYIFAIYAIQNADFYFKASSLDNPQSFLFKPHVAQVVAIFLMLGLGTKSKKFQHHLIQIRTGEGKSIVLAIVASVYALFGFDVYIACYSKFLCERDSNLFQKLFQALDVQCSIKYGTFNDLCEESINKSFNIREQIQNIIVKQNYSFFPQKSKPEIVLIDEVDVFFSMDFYGQSYSPITRLRSKEISDIIDYIWKNKDSNVNKLQVLCSQQYKDLKSSFDPKWEVLIKEAVINMINDLDQFQSHGYTVQDGQIGYLMQDQLVFNQTYGYKTMFAYYHHLNQGISQETLDINKYIAVKCGHFSYTEIPKNFKCILGVTGTLCALSEVQKNTIKQEYGIQTYTIMPSVFGKNNIKFNPKDDFMICEPIEFAQSIVNEIKKRVDNKRAVLVFFEDNKSLEKFYSSEEFELYKDEVYFNKRILTEDLSIQEKNDRIKISTQSRAITLITKSFGRGTDFVSGDLDVKENGGVFVLQTFFSEDYAEEVQIKGRTARQGDQGGYCLVIQHQDLDKLSINPTKDVDQITYQQLHQKRLIFFDSLVQNNQQQVQEALQQHNNAVDLIKNFKDGQIIQVVERLQEINKGDILNYISQTMIIMDATYSMSTLFEKSKLTVQKMFNRIQEILAANNISGSIFQIQFVAYRNYCNEEEQILQVSPWTCQPTELREFLNSIKVGGGLGNEAIEVGLWHANQELQKDQQISQIILIGDASPNTELQIISHKKIKGQDYWDNKQVNNAKHYLIELQALIDQNIPVHAFYVDNQAKCSFEQISQLINGQSEYLEIDSPKGVEQLTGLVSQLVLNNIGNKKGLGNKMAVEYQKKYFY